MAWKVTKVIVFVYLIASAAFSVYALYGLWRLDPAALVEPAGRGEFPDAGKPPPDVPKIRNVDPARLEVGGTQSTLKLYGYNFKSTSKVRLNGVERPAQFVDEHELVVSLTANDTTTPAMLSVTVVGQKSAEPAAGDTSNVLEVPIGHVFVKWVFLWTEATFSLEVRLILLVLFTGALSASIYGIKSFADYAGEETLTASWCWLYFARPIMGSGLAFIFYLVIRAGFLASTNADVKAINPFGFVAVAALVGMFSDKAILKLGDVFNALFQPTDTRSNKLQGLSIALNSLPDAIRATKYGPHQLAKGGTPPYKWTVDPLLPASLSVQPDRCSGGRQRRRSNPYVASGGADHWPS
jgi:hypothetical protein